MLSKGTRLEMTIKELKGHLGHKLKNCIITNERGLIMATLRDNHSENTKTAAMISLASDSAQRISSYVDIAPPEALKIDGKEGTFVMSEFLVKNQRYRIGVVLDKKIIPDIASFRGWFRKKNSEDYVREAAMRVKKILEE